LTRSYRRKQKGMFFSEHSVCIRAAGEWVSEQFLNGTSAHYRPFSARNGG